MVEILVNTGDNQNKSLDLGPNEIMMEIYMSIANIKDISNTSGTYTKSVIIPDTPNNRQVFGWVSNLGSSLIYGDYQFNPNIKKKCYVLDGGQLVMSGYVQLVRVYIDDDLGDSMEIVIYANNTSFYIEMGEKFLTDIDFSEYDFTLTPRGITSSWRNDANSYQDKVFFPLIDYGKKWTLNDLQDPIRYNIGVKDFRPAPYLKTIFDKVLESNGYTYRSNFLGGGSEIADPRFGSAIIPYTQQAFQASTLYDQDKIFHVGLSQSTISTTDDVGHPFYGGTEYVGKYYTGASPYQKKIINAVPAYDGYGRVWFNGYRLSPFDKAANIALKNTALNNCATSYYEDSITVPFQKDTDPLFNTVVSGSKTFDTTNNWYENRTDEVFKQRFSLITDVVTTYSINDFLNRHPDRISIDPSDPKSFRYYIKIDFYRSINPISGLPDTDWATGTGYRIPADLGNNPTALARDSAGEPEKLRHWLVDMWGSSNCFTSGGERIIPSGDDRYLGKYFNNGVNIFDATGDGLIEFPKNSGDCATFYYNDGTNQVTDPGGTPSTYLQGLWASGINSDAYDNQANYQPAYGDWYQRVQCQTIFLDGDETNIYYGASGSILQNGNKPIQPGEKVRCKVTIGGKYYGQKITTNPNSYKPPTAAYLLTTSSFFNQNIYDFTESQPLTTFFNELSPDYISGQRISYNDIIPRNVKQRDFIQNVVQMYNLRIEPDNISKTDLLIEPADEYYSLGSVIDWSDKLDISRPIDIKVLADTQTRRTKFTFTDDADWYNKQYKAISNETYGQFIYDTGNEYATGETNIQSIFSPTPITCLYSKIGSANSILKYGGVTLPVIISDFSNSNGNTTLNNSMQANIRVLMRKYVTTSNGDKIIMFGRLTNAYPYAGPYDDPKNPTFALNWGQTRGEFFTTATDQFYDNLVNTFWATDLSEIADLDSRLVTCNLFLKPEDIRDFSFYNKIFLTIDGVDGYYKVNSIDGYQPGQSETTKVTLIKIKNNLQKRIYRGSTSNPSPIILVIPTGGGGAITGGSPTS